MCPVFWVEHSQRHFSLSLGAAGHSAVTDKKHRAWTTGPGTAGDAEAVVADNTGPGVESRGTAVTVPTVQVQ